MLRLMLFVTLTKMASSLFDEKLHEMYLTMPRAEFVQHFNKHNYTWKMAEEPFDFSFDGCAIADTELHKTLPTIRHSLEAINNAPENFDARTQWPQCDSIGQIYDQGQCGSCWTFGSATTASDRTCIHKGVHVQLSEQDFECLTIVCRGGNNVLALNFWKERGLVTQACKPYDVYKLNQTMCTSQCVDGSINYYNDKHFGQSVYNVGSDIENIKAELSRNGPLVASISVYDDFHYHYQNGIYVHTFGNVPEGHSVRIIGYGVENGVPYWLGANSWGRTWGESGFFRIRQGQPDVGVESYLVTGMP